MNAIALLHYSRNCEAPMLFALEGMCFFDAIADESRARLEVEFVNLSFSAKKSHRESGGIFLSNPKDWYIIVARSAAYIISPSGAVSHHAPTCIYLRLDDIQNFVLMICNFYEIDDIQGYRLDFEVRMCYLRRFIFI